MKNVFILLFVLPVFASAQDTCQLKKQSDPFNHQTKISTGFVNFTNNGIQLSISVDASSTDIDFFLWFSKDSKCFDDQSTIQINYEGDRLKGNFRNSGSMNCEGAFHFSFRNTPNVPGTLQRLTVKKVASFHITGANKTVTDFTFTANQKDQFLKMANCVVQQSKTLLKK